MKVAAEKEDCGSILVERPGAIQQQRARKRKRERGRAISISEREL